jgi:UMF1 family MFS transporter
MGDIIKLTKKSMTKVNLWYLYDFANSFASSVVIFYFPLLLAQGGASDTWIGISTAISTVILLIFYPALGRKADRSLKKRMFYIKLSSFLMVLSLILVGVVTDAYIDWYTNSVLFWLSSLYILFQVSFQGSYVFYSSFLQDFENEGKNKDKVSSLGMGLGQLGNAISIGLIGSLVVGGSFAILGISGKSLALLVGAFIFIVLGAPFLFQKLTKQEYSYAAPEEHKFFTLNEFVTKVISNKKIFYYLVGYMLVADSVATLQIYMTLYLKNVFGFTDKFAGIAGAISMFCLFLTCMILGKYANKITDKKRVLVFGGAVYLATYVMFGLSPNIPVLVYLNIALVGIAYGMFFPLARSLYSDIVPRDQQSEYFSSFVIFERAATIVGPLVWIFISWLLLNQATDYIYRVNLLTLSLIAGIGLLLIRKSFKVF